jgi:hypothetical protein
LHRSAGKVVVVCDTAKIKMTAKAVIFFDCLDCL